MADNDRRTARLAKQPEIEDDDDDDEALPGIRTQQYYEKGQMGTQATAGMPCPTVEPASSSSETSPDDCIPATTATANNMTLTTPVGRKQTLTRTPALEGTSPPPESLLGHYGSSSRSLSLDGHPLPNGMSTSTSVDRSKRKGTSSNQAKEFLLASHDVSNDSGRGTLDNDVPPEIPSFPGDMKVDLTPTIPTTTVYKDATGVDLPAFFKSTLHKSIKDRKTLLSIEKELISFITDSPAQTYKMTEMNTYDRMVTHRVAAYLGLDHNVDQSGKCVIVSRTIHTRIPEMKFSKFLDPLVDSENQPKKQILKRKQCSLEERQNTNFNTDGASASCNLLSTHLPYMPQQRSLDSLRPNMHLFSYPSSTAISNNRQWGSPDSSGYGMGQGHLRVGLHRAVVTKSNSYGGPASTLASLVAQGQQVSCDIAAASSSAVDSTGAIYDSSTTHPSNPDVTTPSGSASTQSPLSGSETAQSPVVPTPQFPTSFAYIVSPDASVIPPGSLIINPQTMELHLNPDGTEYHFDPACPPPFVVQPPSVTPQQIHSAGPPPSIVHQNEQVSDLTSRFAAAASITPIEGMNPAYHEQMTALSQPLSFMPSFGQHTQPGLSSAQPIQYSQPVYYSNPLPAGQTIRYVAYSLPQNSPIVPTAAVDAQSQAPIPMSAIGVPSYPSSGGYHYITPAYTLPPGSVAGPQCYDPASGITYSASSDSSGAGRLVGQSIPVQTFSIAPYPSSQSLPTQQPQPQQQQQQPSHINQQIPQHPHFQLGPHTSSYAPSAQVPSAASFYTGVPLASPRPPSPHAQLPAPPISSSLHQQQPQTAVFYSPNIGNVPMSPLGFPVMPLGKSSPAAVRPTASPGILQGPFRSPTPPIQQQPQSQLQHQSVQSSQTFGQPSPSNGVQHPAQVAVNFGQQPMSVNPNQSMTAQQGSQLVAIPGPYHQIRPLGTIYPVASGQGMAQSGAASYQIIRPGRPAGDVSVRMMNPSAVRPRIPPLPLSGNFGQNAHSRGSNQNRTYGRGGRRSGGREGTDMSPSSTQPRNTSASQGSTTTVAPSPLMPSLSSNRQ